MRGRFMPLSLALSLFCCSVSAAVVPTQRKSSTVTQFKKANACPSTGKLKGSCPGYVVDHLHPLCAGGADTVANLQWQTLREAHAKDGRERSFCKCLKKQAVNPQLTCIWKP